MPKEEKRRIREEKAKAKGPQKRRQTGGFGTSVWQNQPRKLTDKTKCAGTTWGLMKEEAMKPDYKQSEAWSKLDDTAKDIVSHLIDTQLAQGQNVPLDGSVLYQQPTLAKLQKWRLDAKRAEKGLPPLEDKVTKKRKQK